MTELMQIQPFIQAYVQAISSIVEAQVTVVDSQLIRVGGSGAYEREVGQRIPHDSFFQNILRTLKPGIIRNVRKEFACNSCQRRDTCHELANLAYPILLKGEPVGVIGIIAFQERERERLLDGQKKLEEFLKYMSALLESKLITFQQSQELTDQLQEVIQQEKRQIQRQQFLGNHPKIKQILQMVGKISQSDSTVLITGESGTGKEVLAKMIHQSSGRGNKLMISVNCGAIPEGLVESELFGYEEGAFTGAKRRGQPGKFQLADNSTLFLDEIGEMPLQAQIKLLRVLQERAVEPLGAKRPVPVNVRVICATNRNLYKMVEEGRFREDLYYRLNVIPIEIPPLRERRQDIPLFIRNFLASYNQQLHKSLTDVSPEAEMALVQYGWPGNVRELKNMIEYLVNISEGERIELSDLPGRLTQPVASKQTLAQRLAAYERSIFAGVIHPGMTLEEKEAVASQLGISRATFYRKMAQYKLT